MPSPIPRGEAADAASATLLRDPANAGLGVDAPRLPLLDAAAVTLLGRGEALIFDGVLGLATSLALAHALTADPDALTPAAIGRASLFAPAIRGDRTRWLERSEAQAAGPQRELWTLFDHVGAELREKAWLGTRDSEVQLALYPGDEARYRRHRDAFAGRGRRRATAVYYLNPTWHAADGGELRLFTPDGEKDVEPILDRLVVFLAESVEHEVLPCRAARWAATAWYLGPPEVPTART